MWSATREKALLLVLVSAVLAPPLVSAKTCNIQTLPLDFGEYDVFDPMHLDSVGTIRLKCKTDVAYAIYIDAGTGDRGFNPRGMKHAAMDRYLYYNFFVDPARTNVWGDGTAGTSVATGVGQKKPKWVDHSIYARVFAQQGGAVAGIYIDTVTVTIVW